MKNKLLKTAPFWGLRLSCISLFLGITLQLFPQTGSWTLWASGLQQGAYPRLAVAPNHDIFYSLISAGGTSGLVYKANTQSGSGSFTALPAVPLPASHQNNIQCIETNLNNEPVVGIFRTNVYDPWIFRFDNATQQWVAASSNISPTLGAFCMKRAPNGTIWCGPKWTNVYKSTDNGNTWTGIDETASVQSGYPCYYPSWSGASYDGAIYGINVDANGRVYAGTESAGVVYSDDEGDTWHPADLHACKTSNPNQKDTASAMRPVSYAGNVAGLGFTTDNKLIFTGTNMWQFNGWYNELGLANMTSQAASPSTGIPNYLIAIGQQVSKIVTAANGTIFLHSGGSANSSGIGIYTSTDGISWSIFNTGISSGNDNQSQGSLVVDGNLVFMATHDGKVWRYSAVPLAVELCGFSAQRDGASIELLWQTCNEQGYDRFEVEHSPDGISFQTIGTVKGHHNSQVLQHYATMDPHPFNGANYYRLKEIDSDQSFSYSGIVPVEADRAYQVQVVPNPFTDHLNISGLRAANALKIYNPMGQCIWSNNQTGLSDQTIDTQSWTKGVYWISVTLENGSVTTLTQVK
jgi:hypothetical protein